MLSRRAFVASGLAGLAASRASRLFAQKTEVLVTVKAPAGEFRGLATEDAQIFRGVPFAQPPVGALRFRPAVAATSRGVHDATHFAPAAVQPDASTAVGQSENCLCLNVYTPRTPGPHPVLVWIHGGGFTGGHSSDPMFDGTRFTRDEIVCVTVAYRLGVFGFLDMGPLLGESYAGSANNALTDLVAALSWVQHNIAAFGGDPHRVTVGGESAGGKLTDLMMGIPSASPLFHQMISESGGADRCWLKPPALEVSRAFGQTWTAQTGKPASAILQAPAEQLIKLQQTFTRDYARHFPLRPEVDGKFIPQMPLDAIRKGSSRGKRLLIGTMRDESASFIGPHPQRDITAADLGDMKLTHFEQIEQAYAKAFPEMGAEARRIRSVSAEEYWLPSMRVAQAHASQGGETYVYRLDYPGEGRFANLAYHSFDLHFVWERLGADVRSDAHALAQSMHAAWVAFIKGGAPAAAGLPAWPAYKADKQQTMILDAQSRVENGPQAKELALWDGVSSLPE